MSNLVSQSFSHLITQLPSLGHGGPVHHPRSRDTHRGRLARHWESVMRHFLLLSLAVGPLTGRVLAPALEGCLVASTGTPRGFPALDPGTSSVAVDVAMVTLRTDLHQPVTACAVENPVTLDHPNSANRKAGQMGRDRGTLGTGPLALDHRDDPRRSGEGQSLGLHLSAA